mgnify:CR=1 FL=1
MAKNVTFLKCQFKYNMANKWSAMRIVLSEHINSLYNTFLANKDFGSGTVAIVRFQTYLGIRTIMHKNRGNLDGSGIYVKLAITFLT